MSQKLNFLMSLKVILFQYPQKSILILQKLRFCNFTETEPFNVTKMEYFNVTNTWQILNYTMLDASQPWLKNDLQIKTTFSTRKTTFNTTKYLLNMWKINLIVFINCTNSDQQEPATKQKYFLNLDYQGILSFACCLFLFFSPLGEKSMCG